MFILTLLIKDIYKPLLLSIFMGAMVFSISLLKINMVILLLLQLMIGVLIYLLGLYLFMKQDTIAIIHLFIKSRGERK